MKRVLTFSLSVFIFFCMLVATDKKAWGYVDPGSGYMALQAGASMLAAAGFFLRTKIKALFTRKPKDDAKKPAAVVLPLAKTDNRNAA